MNNKELWEKIFLSNRQVELYNAAFDYLVKHTEPESDICKHFGCGAKLNRTEKLFGDRCFTHNKPTKKEESLAARGEIMR